MHPNVNVFYLKWMIGYFIDKPAFRPSYLKFVQIGSRLNGFLMIPKLQGIHKLVLEKQLGICEDHIFWDQKCRELCKYIVVCEFHYFSFHWILVHSNKTTVVHCRKNSTWHPKTGWCIVRFLVGVKDDIQYLD